MRDWTRPATSHDIVSTFAYHRPGTIAELWQLLAESAQGVKLLAGGTDLLVPVNKGTELPRVVIDLKRLDLLRSDISAVGGHLRVGALNVLTDLIGDPRIGRHFPALLEAAAAVGSVQIRNRATLVGNICNASPAADTAPALLVFGAVVNILGPRGERSVPLEEFFLGPGLTVLQPAEIVTSIDLPLPPEVNGSAFVRVTRRRGFDLGTVSVSCLLVPGAAARFGFGAVAPRPLLAVDDTITLGDPDADPTEQSEALDHLLEVSSPISDLRASRNYRLAMLASLSRRALQLAAQRLRSARNGAAA